MSAKFYNFIMASVPKFYSGNEGEFQFPKDRFLQYTEDRVKAQFQSLDQDAINRLKALPTIFAIEGEIADARIGKITDIKVHENGLRAKYKFDEGLYPLTRGVLSENRHKLGISEAGYEFHRGHWGVKEYDLSHFYDEYLKSLTGIAHKLKNTDKKVQLIYAFNGTGKTRLSRELKRLIVPSLQEVEDIYEVDDLFDVGETRKKFLYYNAFTEDLFYWDNDLKSDAEPKLKIQPNSFTTWILKDQGQDQNIISNFQRYANDKLTPSFNEEYKIPDEHDPKKEIIVPAFSEVTFTLERGDDTASGKIKISKGEESNFVWSVFYALLDQVITILNVPDPLERETDQFDQLEYVFIDDPVSSLDENHLIELAVDLATLIQRSKSNLKFIVTTHNPLFYNVLHNELGLNKKDKKNGCYLLERGEDGTFNLNVKYGDSNTSFSYHLYLKQKLEQAIADNQIQKYHFTLLRNLYEKIANFLGYEHWTKLLDTVPGDKDAYLKRIVTFSSHSTLSNEEIKEPTEPEKQTIKLLLDNLNTYAHWRRGENNGRDN